ncbi:MAG: hypothetical protein AAB472_03980, partial [Patescibacteria group bacterium]
VQQKSPLVRRLVEQHRHREEPPQHLVAVCSLLKMFGMAQVPRKETKTAGPQSHFGFLQDTSW